MAATINPVDLHNDPALDGAMLQSGGPPEGAPVARREIDKQQTGALSNGDSKSMAQTQRTADSLVGPPISYRGLDPHADPRLHRSFSQRAKTRPFAAEAFADEDNIDDYPSSKAQPSVEQTVLANHANQQPLQPRPSTPNGPPAQETLAKVDRPQRVSTSKSQGRTRTVIGNEYGSPEAQKSVPRSSTIQDTINQPDAQSRNWRAPDRSPLQKLEVKLTDISKISKEEKRARVQEAETRLRESHGAQGVTRPRQNGSQPTRIASQPTRVPSDPVKPSGVQVAAAAPAEIDRRVPSQTRERRAVQQGPVVSIPVRQYENTGQKRTATAQRSADSQPVLPRENGRSVSANQAINNVAVLSDPAPRSVSLQQQRPRRVPRVDERPVSEREKNASHQAALQQLTGQELDRLELQGGTEVPRNLRNSSLKGAKPDMTAGERDKPGAAEFGTRGADVRNVDYPAPKTSQQPKGQFSPPQTSQRMVGLGLSSPPPTRSAKVLSSENVEPSGNRQHRSSVSFKTPFDKRRPVDEWKTAETAQLTAEDFSAEQVQAPEPYKAWWEQDQTGKPNKTRTSTTARAPEPPIDDRTASFSPALYLKCGPLLRYSGLRRSKTAMGPSAVEKEYWRGTVMIVTQDSQCSYEEMPTLRIFSQPKKLLPPPPALVTGDQLAPEYIDPIAGLNKLSRTGRALYVRPVDHLEEVKDLSRIEDDNGIYEASPSPLDVNGSKSATAAATNKRTSDVDGESLGRYKEVKGTRLYADPDRDVTFWRFNIEIELGSEQQHVAYRINKSAAVGFWVPAREQTMNTMFHSCNGFSLAVDTNSFSGPDPLWRDVLNNHQTRPFHVMIGGGDQVYNDRVMVDTHHFGEWTKMRNPQHKHKAVFTPEMKEELETFYLERYAMWFSQGLFGMANASIPMVNIWDDHDIIDGFGSYPDDFMKSPVFMGLGEVAHKYYLLFQHQTIDAMTEKDEPSWILGKHPGPYIQKVSRSVYVELGQRVAFLGLDGRTERTRHDVLSIETLELVLERCRREIIEGQTKHLIVLLGVPIAYPRLVWLENVLTSRALDPLKALHRAGIVNTKLLNKFDGGVEILDDLDDHWTAKDHKDERNILMEDLQDLAAEKSVRITILSGDVHLAAIGQFYSNPKLKIPKDRDHRYMPNVVSSAIVNTPPPDMMADALNKRNKVHHLNKYTDENMIPMFTHDVDDKKRNNTRLLPRRNWCSIREYAPGSTPPPTPSPPPSIEDDDFVDPQGTQHQAQRPGPKRRLSLTKNDFNPRNLMRRLSSRGKAPPNSYRENADSEYQSRATSLDGAEPNQALYGQSPQIQPSTAAHVPDVPALRPSMFKRRPTNLSEKAARKGIVPDVDAEGNEVHFNDHVNLEGGLDIILNCEVNQKDPAGITAQYRLLVPALWYDGSSDREKLDAAPPLNRRNTLLQRFGLQSRHSNRAADTQGAGNWGQEMSETDSYTESDQEHDDPPKKRFSFFGSMRKKRTQQQDIEHTGDSNIGPIHNERSQPEAVVHTGTNHSNPPNDARELQHYDDSDDISSSTDSVDEQPKSQHTGQLPQQSQTLAYPPPVQQGRPFQQQSYQPPTEQPTEIQPPPLQQTNSRSSQQHTTQPLTNTPSYRSSQRSSRPLSYVIGGTNDLLPKSSNRSSSQANGQPLYDPDAEYVSKQNRSQAAGTQRSNSASYSNPGRASNNSVPEDRNIQPEQRQLRGNGIIGKNVPPSSFRNSASYNDNDRPRPQSQGSSNDSQGQPMGYSGIEAYKEPKPKRRWSLRERARNAMGSFNSRRRKDDNEWYSDEEDEAYWEGQSAPRRY